MSVLDPAGSWTLMSPQTTFTYPLVMIVDQLVGRGTRTLGASAATRTQTSMPETKEITLIRRSHDYAKKCPMCSYRTTVLWNIGEDENEELAACGSCTTEYLADHDEYTLIETIG